MHKETFTLAIQVRLGAGLLGNAGGFLASNQLSTPLGVIETTYFLAVIRSLLLLLSLGIT